MEKTWRWFGRKAPITLPMLRQIGVEGIVTALHDIPNGEVWMEDAVLDLKDYIESHGLRWSVVESLPVSESIKYGGPDRDALSRVGGYGVAKSGVSNFTKWLAAEMATKYGEKIRVNALAPGFFIGKQNRSALLNPDGSATSANSTARHSSCAAMPLPSSRERPSR